MLCYKNKDNSFFNKYIEERNYKNEYTNPDNDKRGPYKQAIISDTEEKSNPNSERYYTITSPTGVTFKRQWRVEKWEMDELIADNRIYWGINGDSVPSLKAFINEPKLATPSSLLSNLGTAKTAGNAIEEIFNDRTIFSYPKPVELVEHLIKICTQPQYTLNPKYRSSRKVFFPNANMHVQIKNGTPIVLDFFAGSGTTGHAVMKLNAEDGGNRKFILCTNNENNICRDVTYERIKRVIAKENYPASLKYMKVNFVPITDKFYYEYADELLKHVKELVELENGINFNGNQELAIILTEAELDAFTSHLPAHCKTIYLGHDILPSGEQEAVFKQNKIKVNIIPDYYYRDLEG